MAFPIPILAIIAASPALAAAAASFMRLWIQHGPSLMAALSETIPAGSSTVSFVGFKVGGNVSPAVHAAAESWVKFHLSRISVDEMKMVVDASLAYIRQVNLQKGVVDAMAQELLRISAAKNLLRMGQEGILRALEQLHQRLGAAVANGAQVVSTRGVPVKARTVPGVALPGGRGRPPGAGSFPLISQVFTRGTEKLRSLKGERLLNQWNLRVIEQNERVVLQALREVPNSKDPWRTINPGELRSFFKSPDHFAEWLEVTIKKAVATRFLHKPK
jgi:hypothetical protein